MTSVIPDSAFERPLTVLRRLFLTARNDPQAPAARGSDGLVAFAVALANQCFLTDYAYAETADETAMADALTARIAAAAAAGEAIAMADLATLAAYRPLHEMDFAAALLGRDWPPSLEPVIQRQLREPAKEAELRETISRITPIADATSRTARAGDGDRPFRRWFETPVYTHRFSLADWLQGIAPERAKAEAASRNPTAPLEILVAGCGTGQEAITSATRFANSEVLAVDLSLAGLAYARRRTDEIGLKNIDYAQADILELDGLGRQFDIVECAGVLQQLSDPLAGWRALARLTKPGGYLMMGLPSRLGQHDLEPAQAFIAEHGYGTTPGELRRFRADIMALLSDDPVRSFVKRRDDFYNLSMLRDLLFDPQAHRFSIPEISATLDELGLEFCGFAVDPETRMQFAERFGKAADFASLTDWDSFETEYPDSFSAMYHFLVRKPD